MSANTICRVTVFGPSPSQWICREWGQKLGCDETTVCFGDGRHTKSSGPIVPGRGDPLLEDGNAPTPSQSRRSLLSVSGPPSSFSRPLFGWFLLLFIPLFRSSSSYTCQLSMHILKCTSPQSFFLALCELLWPLSPYPGVTSTSKGIRVLVVRI